MAGRTADVLFGGLLKVFLTPSHLCIVMEYGGAKSLHDHLCHWHGLSESVARWFFQQLLLAVDYCHRKVGLTRRTYLRLRSSDRIWDCGSMCSWSDFQGVSARNGATLHLVSDSVSCSKPNFYFAEYRDQRYQTSKHYYS